ncbi:MAG: MarR family winged helix-turn-helix transcriptional regulator [Parvibaculum sp.]|nr:MarR family winged helix-turn-helix transcriptional regulator [Parvibaculum sp.]
MGGKTTPQPKQRQGAGVRPDETFGWLHHDVYRLFRKAWARQLEASGTGINPAKSRILAELRRRDGLTQTELADAVEMEKAPLGRLLDALEAQRLIARRNDPADRRVRRVYVTPRIEELTGDLWQAAFGMFETAVRDFTPAEYAQLMDFLERIKSNLQEAEEPEA